MRRVAALCLLLVFTAAGNAAQPRRGKAGPRSAGRPNPIDKQVDFAALEKKLAQWKQVKMPFDTRGLTSRQVKLVNKLVDAAHYLEDIFLRQSDPEVVGLMESLKTSKNPKDQELLRMLRIQGSRYDLLAENAPLIGSQPMSPDRGLYPSGLTREQIEDYVKQHPDKKNEIYGDYTIVRRNGDELVGIPYHIAYRQFLEPAAKDLRDAAALSDDKDFANFLRLRADALLSDDYYKSDLAWVDLKDPKIDVILAPYESYTDDVLGVKTSYGVAILVRDEAESQKLAVFQKYVPDIQDALPLDAADRPSKRGQPTPMEVMNAPFRAGDLRHGYQAVADNLPNDPRIHEQKGTKKIFFKNFMDARVNDVILPIAKELMDPEQAAHASGEGYLASTMMHEISHGLGPAFSRVDGKQVDIREAIGPLFSGLEEAKADVVGMYGLKWLVDRGALPKERLPEFYSSYVAGIFRTVRFSIAEAHGRAEMMEFNYLSEQNAIKRDAQTRRYSVDYERMPEALAALAKELLEIEATGDRQRAEKWFTRYEKMPSELQSALQAVSHVPVDVDPVFSFPEPIQ
ncbi:MAG: Zn-dependent hydrolase [Acidobacteria bacterium]|nr:MAG: Zn-dependent hydrolase [Acidobacteriota bacterium]